MESLEQLRIQERRSREIQGSSSNFEIPDIDLRKIPIGAAASTVVAACAQIKGVMS